MSAGYMNNNVCNELNRLLSCFKSDNEEIKEIKPYSILVYGINGVGKTALVKECFDHTGLVWFWIDSSMLDEKETLADVLNKIEDTGARVTIIDDLEQIVTEDDISSKSETYLAIRNFIDNMTKNGKLIIAIANDLFYGRTEAKGIWNFDYRIEVPLMKDTTPHRISEGFWKHRLDGFTDEKAITSIFAGLSTDEMEEIDKKKRIYEVGDSEAYEYKRILNAAVEVLFGIPYLLSVAPEDITKQRFENAVYEAGRIIVSEITKPGSIRISTIHRLPGECGGNTLRYESFDPHPTMKYHEDEVMYMLAGKAAIETVYGQVDATCKDDLKKAFKIVYDCETQLCPDGFDVYSAKQSLEMGVKVKGLGTFSKARREQQYLGTDESSEYLQAIIRTAVSDRMDSLYEKTCKLIKDNRSFLDAIVYHLANSYTITQLEISRMYIESSRKNRWFLKRMEG